MYILPSHGYLFSPILLLSPATGSLLLLRPGRLLWIHLTRCPSKARALIIRITPSTAAVWPLISQSCTALHHDSGCLFKPLVTKFSVFEQLSWPAWHHRPQDSVQKFKVQTIGRLDLSGIIPGHILPVMFGRPTVLVSVVSPKVCRLCPVTWSAVSYPTQDL